MSSGFEFDAFDPSRRRLGGPNSGRALALHTLEEGLKVALHCCETAAQTHSLLTVIGN